MVVVNLGSADHSVVPLYQEDDVYVSDPAFDVYEVAEDVHSGLVVKAGRIMFFAETLEQAEDVQTGIYMVRKLLRNWIDS